MTESRKHLEHHQALFRELNDQIREGANLDVSIFVCECGSEDCTSTVALSLEEFKRIRSNSTWFVVKTRSCQSGDRPGHQRPRRLRRRREARCLLGSLAARASPEISASVPSYRPIRLTISS